MKVEQDKHTGRMRRWLPYLALLLFTALFYRTVLFSTDTFIPWDLPGYHLPLAVVMSKALRAGHLPLWDTDAFCGRPLYAQLSGQLFYPFRTATLLAVDPSSHVGMLRALEVELALHVFLAGVFALWLARRLGFPGPAALLSAVGFSLGCYFASQAEHIGAIESAAWLPLAWLGVVLLYEKATFARFSLLTAALTMMFLAGFTPSAIPMFGSVVLFSVFYGFAAGFRLRPALLTVAAMAAVFVIAAVQILPTQELSSLSLGSTRAEWRGSGGGIALRVLGTLVWPNYLGGFSWATFDPKYEITHSYIYNGIIPLLAAVVGLFVRPSRLKFALLALLGLAALLMIGDNTAFGKAVFLALPRFLRGPLYPQHWMVVFSLCLSLLAGCGVASLPFLKRRWGYALVVIAAADLVVMSSNRPMNTSRYDVPSVGVDEAVDGERAPVAAMRAAAAASVPSPRIDAYKNAPPAWPTAGSLTGMPSANGIDALALLRILKVRAGLNGGVMWAYSTVQHVQPRLLSAMNVRYVVTKDPIEPAELEGAGLAVTKTFPGQILYENSGALPRFFFVLRVKPVAGLDEAVAYMNRPEWNPAHDSAVEGFSEPDGAFATGSVEVVKYAGSSVLLRTRASGRGFLASSETHYPGWHATVDGAATPIYYTNGAFRGIVVPPGEHVVAFEFAPAILYRSAAISLTALLLMAGGLLLTYRTGLIYQSRYRLSILLENAARAVRP